MIMKNIFKSLLLVGAMAFTFTACDDPDGLDNWFDKPEADRSLTLTIPGESLELTEDNASEMLTFSWNLINPPSEEYTINYVFKIGVVGDNYTTCLSSGDLGSEVSSYTLSKRQLNRFIVQVYGQNPNVEAQLQAKVLAYIDGGQFYYKPSISEQVFVVKPYDISLQRLYLVGDANPAGSAAENGMEITAVNKNYFYQKLNAVLKPNSSFVVSLQNTSTYPAFMDGGDGKMVYVASEADAANYSAFKTLDPYVEGTHGVANNYAVSVDYNDEGDVPTGGCYVGRYCTLPVYAVGDAVTGGWGTWVALNWDYKNPDELTLSNDFKDKTSTGSEGCFKLHSSETYNDPSWRPVVANADARSDHRVTTSSAGDLKWNIPDGTAGSYTLHFKNHEMWISLEAN